MMRTKQWEGRVMGNRFRNVLGICVVFLLAAALAGCGDCDLEIKTDVLPDGVEGQSYEIKLNANCGGDYWFLAGGSLPPGIRLRSDGWLSGRPTLSGVYAFTIGVEDGFNGNVTSKGFSLRIFR